MGGQRDGTSLVRIAATAGLVFIGCYVGASVGTWLRFPEIGSALVYPPYAIVTAALWGSRPRHWWLFLLAASTGTFLPHRDGGFSASFVLLAELVNHLRSVLAAMGLRRYAGRLGTLREMVAFLTITVVIAPAVAGLGGAAIVTTYGTTSTFVLAWQQWWLSNAITAVTLLPVLTIDVRKVVAIPPRRLAEVALFVVALIAVTAVLHAYLHPAHMYWALPFLLLAAARFGVRATSVVLLAVSILSIWSSADAGLTSVRSSASLLELQVFLIEVSIPLLLLAVLIDDQRRTAAALTESRRQYRSVVEDQTELICRFRPDGTYTFANRAYCDAFDVSDPVGSSIWSAVPAGVHSTSSELQLLTPASPQWTHDVNLAEDGAAPRWQQWQERGLFDERGVVVEYQAVGRDITDRKRAETDRLALEAQRSVEKVLREADRRKDEFLAMLGHELRNPLAPMGIAVEVLMTASPGSSEATWARDSIARQLRKMTRLIDDLLDLSRVTLGRIQLQVEHVELSTVIANAVEETRPFIDAHRHVLVVSLPDEPVSLRADGIRLTQVVANLLHNAAKYTERGGLIEVTVKRADTGIELSVRDNGIGIEPDALEGIFALFSQMPAARTRAQGGLGIGLTLVRRLVELHGGTVTARSAGRNRGSEFVVRLPLAANETAMPRLATGPTEAPSKTSLRILAVDDNVDIAKGLAAVLGLWGHTVRTAHDGASALKLAASFAPEVVLLDLGLPNIDGIEVARQLRQRADTAPSLLVSMSGFGHDYVRQQVGETGFHHHVVKPIDLDWLRTLLEDCAKER